MYPNTTHTFSKCRECFRDWEVLEIYQNKPVRLGKCNRVYFGIRKTSKDKTLRNPLVVEVWRAQVHWVDWALRVFNYSCTLTYLLVDRFRLEGSRRGFSSSSLVSSSITRLGVIFCLHFSSFTLVLYFYCLLFICMH